MRKSTIAICLLAAALVAANLWWAYKMVDVGVSYSYQNDSLMNHQEALTQALAVIRAVAAPGATREQVVAAARSIGPAYEPFEKDGYLWVGRLGLRFDAGGKLLEAIPDWSP